MSDVKKKKCRTCGENKDYKEFHNLKSNNDGKNNYCKSCRSKTVKKSYFKNKEKNKEKSKLKNQERKKIKSNWYYEDKNKNPDKYKTRWDEQNKKRRDAKAKWFQENKDRIISTNLERRKKDPKKKITHLMSSGILKSLRDNKKGKKWETLVGYTIDDLINNLQLNEKEYINNNLHIDHIIPINFYNYTSFEDDNFKKCWNLRNLRLIPSEENLSKSDKIDKELILYYNIEDLLPEGVEINDL